MLLLGCGLPHRPGGKVNGDASHPLALFLSIGEIKPAGVPDEVPSIVSAHALAHEYPCSHHGGPAHSDSAVHDDVRARLQCPRHSVEQGTKVIDRRDATIGRGQLEPPDARRLGSGSLRRQRELCRLLGREHRDEHIHARRPQRLHLVLQPITASRPGHRADPPCALAGECVDPQVRLTGGSRGEGRDASKKGALDRPSALLQHTNASWESVAEVGPEVGHLAGLHIRSPFSQAPPE